MEWIAEELKKINRRQSIITYDPHYIIRESERNLNIDLVEKTVRQGTVVVEKCTFPDRLCFKMYFGKSNETYEVPVKIFRYFMEVKSAWKRKGRR